MTPIPGRIEPYGIIKGKNLPTELTCLLFTNKDPV